MTPPPYGPLRLFLPFLSSQATHRRDSRSNHPSILPCIRLLSCLSFSLSLYTVPRSATPMAGEQTRKQKEKGKRDQADRTAELA
ncbi:hypothetical protein KC316_g9 [Hortaea werneckii]|nr:hypothetical protein KC316_g9 [Hortaea werneckii]